MTDKDGISIRQKSRGLIGVRPKVPIKDTKTLSLVYTPGVAKPCLEIEKDHLKAWDYTIRGNTIAVISDGSRVYGLGDVGPEASIPQLEAKCVFHKTFANVDAIPLAVDSDGVDDFVEIVRYLAPTFGGIHLEGITAPNCFAIEERLKRAVSLPILHADQQGAAVIVYAALLNALKVVNKNLKNCKVVISGAGAGGTAVAKLLMHVGVGDVKVCDSKGVLYYRRTNGLNWAKSELAHQTNPQDVKGKMADVLVGADVFIGLSTGNVLTAEMIQQMGRDPIVFAMALPTPEISYEAAKAAGAKVVATSLSTHPNHMRASLAVPGIFRGALDVQACRLNKKMLVAAAEAIANYIKPDVLDENHILPEALDFRVAAKVARAVAQSAMDQNLCRTRVAPEEVERRVIRYLQDGAEAWVEPPAPGIEKESNDMQALDLHQRYHGMLEIVPQVPITDIDIYRNVYSSPNAAEPCKVIAEHPERVFDLTLKNNLVGIVTDGSAVLGLGNIGPGAGLPVMEGKAVLFKTFGGVEAVPICLRTQDIEEIIETVKKISSVFGGINLEDISAPRCFEIEDRLINELDIPVFHDDQHGTAVVVVAGLLNAAKIVNKPIEEIQIVVNGAGASALSVSNLLLKVGVRDIVICDTKGVIYEGRKEGMNPFKEKIARTTNLSKRQGSLEDVLVGADMFLGLSAPGMLNGNMVKTMAKDPIIFALANPTPEIMPDEAKAAGARVIATGRSDFPNQVNNSLAFPGIFRGAMDTRARRINVEMKVAAAYAIAGLITPDELAQGKIIPGALDIAVPPAVAGAVAQAAIGTGVARISKPPSEVASHLDHYLKSGEFTNDDVVLAGMV